MFTQACRSQCIALFMGILLVGVSVKADDGPLNVYVVNYPLKYFAERIGGSHVRVTLPVPADEDPVYWVPTVADIAAYQQADLILLNGAGYAKWVSKVSLPHAKTVDTSRGFKEQYITVTEITTHSHGAEGEHAHEGIAFTTWLDLSLATMQAKAIAEALARKLPEQEDFFRTHFRSLEKDLLALDNRIRSIVSSNNDLPLIFSHPVYDYFENAYSLNGKSVHWEPDQDLRPDQFAALKKVLKLHPARWIVWEDTPLASTVEALNGMGIKSVVFNPCGNEPDEGDFLIVMRQNVANLEQLFR